MAQPSLGRLLVETQKRITATHRQLLTTPLGPLVNALTPGRGVLVLRTTGRTSGLARETVLSYFEDGGDVYVIGSDGGAARHPDWYANLAADPAVAYEIDGEWTEATAETVTGDDRPRLWRKAVSTYLGYALYQARADRQIPVVRLRVC